MSSRTLATYSGTALLACALLAGCAEEAPPLSPRQAAAAHARHQSVRGAPRPFVIASAPAANDRDALETPDGLLAGAGKGAAESAALPLAPHSLAAPAPPPAYEDAQTQTVDILTGKAVGLKMPTVHSHWLKGPIFSARVAVRVNGLLLGTFTSPQDRDITMKLRSGINTVTLAYTPLTSTASAHLDILESEHDPPIAPLATFRSPLPAANSSTSLQTTTQTLTVLAR